MVFVYLLQLILLKGLLGFLVGLILIDVRLYTRSISILQLAEIYSKGDLFISKYST